MRCDLLTYLLFCVSPDNSVCQADSTDFSAVLLLQLDGLQASFEMISSV